MLREANMLGAYAHLMHLLVYQPDRLGWLLHHAWHWHKGPIAAFTISTAAAVWAITELVGFPRKRSK